MCGQLGQFADKMTWREYVELLNDWLEIQVVLSEPPPPKSYHTPTGKRCLILLQEEPGKLRSGQFGCYVEYKGKMNWRFNIRSEGGWENSEEDPKYAGPWNIFSNPYGAEQIMKRRCVIPVNFFVEQPLGGKPKKKFIIRKKSNDNSFPIFFLGGIYNWITDPETGEIFPGFTLITTAAAPIMKPVLHPRSPLVIPNERVAEFLKPGLSKAEICSFFGPFDSSDFETFEVDPVIAKKILPVPEDDENLIKPISEIYAG